MYTEKQLKNLTNLDNNIAVSGFVVSKQENSFVLDDKTSQLVVLSNEDINIGDYVRVFGNLIFNNNEKLLQASIVQNFNAIDKELHQKIMKML